MLTVVLAYAAMALSWGGTWVVAKAAVLTIPPLELSTIRFAIVAIVLLVACAVLRIPLGTRHLGAVALAGLVGITGYNALVFVALTVAPLHRAPRRGPHDARRRAVLGRVRRRRQDRDG